MSDEDRVRLQHMLDAAEEAMSFAAGQMRADLDYDRKLVLALVKDIEIIGEAAFRIAPAVQEEMPDIPWDDIVGMRHRLVHAYFDINLDILWRTVQDDLPPLVVLLQNHLLDR
ncbi:MAG: DUF86 domain-containing protein [Caldilineaceae bacterium]|nr:DUF86 domain-containing protein [Caldilineaceae bacterium]